MSGIGSAGVADEPFKAFYEGTTLHVRSYDSINNDSRAVIRGDTDFYLALARRAGGDVLEIGVGTGRVALRMIQAGISVTGFDASAAMLRIARAKAEQTENPDHLGLELGNMTTLDLGNRRFGLVIVPFRAFQCLLTSEDQLSALAAFRRHLRPDGLLAMHLFDPDLRFLVPGTSGPVERHIGIDQDTGRPVEAILEAVALDHVMQIRRDRWCYRAFDADGTIAEEERLELALRWIFRWEMRHLLALSGFVVEAEFSDFAGSAPAYGKEQIWLARKCQDDSAFERGRTPHAETEDTGSCPPVS